MNPVSVNVIGEIENTAISTVKSVFDKKIECTTVGELLSEIRAGTYREAVEQIRAAHAANKVEEVASLKRNLPVIMWAGRFSSRKQTGLVEFSGLVCVSMDNLGDAQASRKASLAADSHVISVFYTPTMSGMKVIFRCDPARPHWESAVEVMRYVKRTYEVDVDPECRNAAAVCYVSYDPEAYVNFKATPIPCVTVPTVRNTVDQGPAVQATVSPDQKKSSEGNRRSGPPEAYFDPFLPGYWIKNNREEWIPITELQLRRQLMPFLSSKREAGALSELDVHLNHLQIDCDINFAGPLAGNLAGCITYQGNRILVTKSPEIIQAESGAWPLLKAVIENLLIDEEADQTPYFYGWLKIAREALVAGRIRPGQALVIAGPKDCGKSLVQALITPLLGNRTAKPYGWMIGKTDFNSELFGAEHLVIEDEVAATDLRSRRIFGSKLKEVTVNSNIECHPKHSPKLTLPAWWRTSITVNDEPENLMVLPPLDDSILDKVILLRANKHPMPMPTTTLLQKEEFWNRLIAELPAFCAFLDNWEIPESLQSERFGITHYHHPAILGAIDDLAPETRLLELIETSLLRDDGDWEGSAADLEKELKRIGALSEREADKVFPFNTACGVYLARLAKKHPNCISKRRTRDAVIWIISRDPDRDDAD